MKGDGVIEKYMGDRINLRRRIRIWSKDNREHL